MARDAEPEPRPLPEPVIEAGLTGAETLDAAARYLSDHGVESPRVEAEALLLHALGLSRPELHARREGLPEASTARFAALLWQRAGGRPLQHLTGGQQFLDLWLRVRPGVFVPRPETESLVEAALESMEGVRAPAVVDVGTGTGAVALAIKHARPDAGVEATDSSPEAVALARENAGELGLEVAIRRGDLLAPLPGELRGRIDLVVSNPPYVTEDEYRSLPVEVLRDPREALVGGTQLHRRLAAEAPEWLAPRGWLLVEIGATQGAEVRAIFEGSFGDVEVLPDLAGRDRVVRGRIRAGD